MADKSVYSIDVDTEAFERFKADFDAYTATLKASVDDWKAVAKAINNAKGQVKGLTDAMRQAKAANDNAQQRDDRQDSRKPQQVVQKMDPAFQNAMRGMNDKLSTVASEMKKVSFTLLRQAGSYAGGATQGVIGGAEGILSGLSKEGLVQAVVTMAAAAVTAPMLAAFAAAPDVANLRRQGLGLGGLGVGEMRAARAAGSWMDNPTQGLQATVAARRDIAGPQFQAYAQLFGLRGAQAEMGKDPGKAQFDYLDKAVEKLNKFPENLQDTMAQTFGMTNVFSLATIRAWQAMSGTERGEHRQRWEEVQRQTAMSPEDSKKWFDFYDKLKMSGEIMESGIIKKLQPLIGPLSEWVSQLADMVNKDDGVIKDWIDELGKIMKENPPDVLLGKIQEGLKGIDFKQIGADMMMLAAGLHGLVNNPIFKYFVGSGATAKSGGVNETIRKYTPLNIPKALQQEADPSAPHAATPLPWLTNAIKGVLGDPFHSQGAAGVAKAIGGPELGQRGEAGSTLGFKPWGAMPAWKPPPAHHWWQRKRAEIDSGVNVASLSDDAGLAEFIQQHPESLGPKKKPGIGETVRGWFKGGQELKPKGIGAMNWGNLATGFAPPWARGIYNTLKPDTAESGELPLRMSGARPEHPHSTGRMPGNVDVAALVESRKQTELLSGIKDNMDKAAAFGGGSTLAPGGLTGGGGGGGIGPGQPRITGPGGVDLSGGGETGGATGVSGGGGVRGVMRRLGMGGLVHGGAPTGIARRGSASGGAPSAGASATGIRARGSSASRGGGGGGAAGGGGGGGGGGGSSDDSGVATGGAAKGSVAAAIFAGESKGDYNIYNRNPTAGHLSVGHMDFSKMTVGEVMQAQKEGKVFAAGAYQVIPKTMAGAVSSLKIDPNTKFDKATQDKIFSGYLATAKKGRGPLEDYIKGKSDNSDAALKSAAQEWASIQYHGRGMYDQAGVNRGGIGDARMLAAMKNARESYAKTGNYQGALFGQADTNAPAAKTNAAVAAAAPSPRPSGPGRSPSGPAAQQTAQNQPLGLHQWQMEPRPKIEMHNKTGADMHLSASTMAV